MHRNDLFRMESELKHEQEDLAAAKAKPAQTEEKKVKITYEEFQKISLLIVS